MLDIDKSVPGSVTHHSVCAGYVPPASTSWCLGPECTFQCSVLHQGRCCGSFQDPCCGSANQNRLVRMRSHASRGATALTPYVSMSTQSTPIGCSTLSSCIIVSTQFFAQAHVGVEGRAISIRPGSVMPLIIGPPVVHLAQRGILGRVYHQLNTMVVSHL